MPGEKDDIRRAIRDIANVQTTFNTIICNVIANSVDGIFCDVKPLDGAELKKVRLNGHSEGLIITPADDSFVFVTLLNENDSFVSKFSTIQKITLDVKEDVIINEGKNDGLVKIKELTNKLNALKDDLNTFVTVFNSHIHTTTATVGAAAVPGTIAATTTQASQTAPFIKSDYENTKIKH